MILRFKDAAVFAVVFFYVCSTLFLEIDGFLLLPARRQRQLGCSGHCRLCITTAATTTTARYQRCAPSFLFSSTSVATSATSTTPHYHQHGAHNENHNAHRHDDDGHDYDYSTKQPSSSSFFIPCLQKNQTNAASQLLLLQKQPQPIQQQWQKQKSWILLLWKRIRRQVATLVLALSVIILTTTATATMPTSTSSTMTTSTTTATTLWRQPSLAMIVASSLPPPSTIRMTTTPPPPPPQQQQSLVRVERGGGGNGVGKQQQQQDHKNNGGSSHTNNKKNRSSGRFQQIRRQQQQPASIHLRRRNTCHHSSSTTDHKQQQQQSSLLLSLMQTVVRNQKSDSIWGSSRSRTVEDVSALSSSSAAAGVTTVVSISPFQQKLVQMGVLVAAATAGTATGQRLAVLPPPQQQDSDDNDDDDDDDFDEDIPKTMLEEEEEESSRRQQRRQQQEAHSKAQRNEKSSSTAAAATTTTTTTATLSLCTSSNSPRFFNDSSYSEMGYKASSSQRQLTEALLAKSSAAATSTTATATSMDAPCTPSFSPPLDHLQPYSEQTTTNWHATNVSSSERSSEELSYKHSQNNTRPLHHPNQDVIIQAFLNRTLADALQQEEKMYSTRSKRKRRSPKRNHSQPSQIIDSQTQGNLWVQRVLEESEERLRRKAMLELGRKENKSNEETIVMDNTSTLNETATDRDNFLNKGSSSYFSSSLSLLKTTAANATTSNISSAELLFVNTFSGNDDNNNSSVKPLVASKSLLKNPMTTSDETAKNLADIIPGVAKNSTRFHPLLVSLDASSVVKALVNETEQMVKTIEERFKSSFDVDLKQRPTENLTTLDQEGKMIMSHDDEKSTNEIVSVVELPNVELGSAYNSSRTNESFAFVDMGLDFFNDVVRERKESMNAEPTALYKEEDKDCVVPLMSSSDNTLIDPAKPSSESTSVSTPLLDGSFDTSITDSLNATMEKDRPISNEADSAKIKKPRVSKDFKEAFQYKPGEMEPIVEGNESLESLISLRQSRHRKNETDPAASPETKLALTRSESGNSTDPSVDQHDATNTTQSEIMDEKEARPVSLIRSDSLGDDDIHIDTPLNETSDSLCDDGVKVKKPLDEPSSS